MKIFGDWLFVDKNRVTLKRNGTYSVALFAFLNEDNVQNEIFLNFNLRKKIKILFAQELLQKDKWLKRLMNGELVNENFLQDFSRICSRLKIENYEFYGLIFGVPFPLFIDFKKLIKILMLVFLGVFLGIYIYLGIVISDMNSKLEALKQNNNTLFQSKNILIKKIANFKNKKNEKFLNKFEILIEAPIVFEYLKFSKSVFALAGYVEKINEFETYFKNKKNEFSNNLQIKFSKRNKIIFCEIKGQI